MTDDLEAFQLSIDRIFLSGQISIHAIPQFYRLIRSRDYSSEEQYLLVSSWEQYLVTNYLSIDICGTAAIKVQEDLDEWEDAWLELLANQPSIVYFGENEVVLTAIKLIK